MAASAKFVLICLTVQRREETKAWLNLSARFGQIPISYLEMYHAWEWQAQPCRKAGSFALMLCSLYSIGVRAVPKVRRVSHLGMVLQIQEGILAEKSSKRPHFSNLCTNTLNSQSSVCFISPSSLFVAKEENRRLGSRSHTITMAHESNPTCHKRVVVVGGGAAGFMSAIEAARAAREARRSLDITILESSTQVLQKVRISGGGRCNVLHDESKPIKMISEG